MHGEYFDLEALADTKLRKDKGDLVQKMPVLDRQLSTDVANYSVALSVFRSSQDESVDEVFRRINSGGRRLSRQGLRQAGTLSSLADAVRVIASQIRGDTSPGDSVPLRRMPQLSITNAQLSYGVDVDGIFWVKEGVLRREDVRESLDEQLVLDILVDILIDPMPNSGTRIRDDYYDYTDQDGGPTRASVAVTGAIAAYGPERLADDFMRTYDVLRTILRAKGQRFSVLVNAGSGGRSPRYLHGVYLALFELMFKDRLRLRNADEAATALAGVGAGPMQVPGGGGDWTRAKKRASVDAVKGVLRSSFEGPVNGDDLGRFGYASQLETILGNALVEQQLFECKQGFFTLADVRTFDDASFIKICKTLAAMSNMGPIGTGYVVVGIADNAAAAARVEVLDSVHADIYRGFRIVGIDRESALRDSDLNDYWHWLMQRFESSSLDARIGTQVKADARLVSYGTKAVLVLKVLGTGEPTYFDGEIYERRGSDTVAVPKEEYMRVFSRFTRSA
ncbi:MAG: ATP-binding protein [Actinomycetota bacterium]|nr:ATP-binding protein [Actinomycetota bacterium]